jgi:hypothetical protein
MTISLRLNLALTGREKKVREKDYSHLSTEWPQGNNFPHRSDTPLSGDYVLATWLDWWGKKGCGSERLEKQI